MYDRKGSMALARPDGARKAYLHWGEPGTGKSLRQQPGAGPPKVKAGRRVPARLPASAEVNRMAREHGLTPQDG